MKQILEKIDSLRREKGLSVYKLTIQAELSENTIYNWYKKNYCPTLDALEAVCRVLDISLFSLFATNESEALTSQEEQLISIFRKLSSSEKEILFHLATDLKKLHED